MLGRRRFLGFTVGAAAGAAVGVVQGFGPLSYQLGLRGLVRILEGAGAAVTAAPVHP